MADPKRILQKILGKDVDLAPYEASGEPLDLLIEVLREILRVRRFREWLLEHTGMEAALTPKAFHSLLDLPEINFTETADRDLNVHQHSLKDARQVEDAVTVANMNTYLRELFRDLNGLYELKTKEHTQLALAPHMTGDLVDRVESYLRSLHELDWRGVGYLLTGSKAKKIEKNFQDLFPDARGVHPLRENIPTVMLELGFFRRTLEINIKWAVTGLDLFRVLREDTLNQTLQNVSEIGSGLWNIVYNGMQLPTCMDLAGVDFQNARTLFESERVPLHFM